MNPSFSVITDPTTHVLIDSSNLWIEGQKINGLRINLQTKNVPLDPRMRLNWRGLVETVSAGRKHVDVRCYGSRSRSTSNKAVNMATDMGIKMEFVVRNLKGREKGVDVKISSDILSLVHFAKTPGTLVLVSGDGDFADVLADVAQRGWCVEIWFWKHATAMTLQNLVHQFPNNLRLFDMSMCVHNIMFCEFKSENIRTPVAGPVSPRIFLHGPKQSAIHNQFVCALDGIMNWPSTLRWTGDSIQVTLAFFFESTTSVVPNRPSPQDVLGCIRDLEAALNAGRLRKFGVTAISDADGKFTLSKPCIPPLTLDIPSIRGLMSPTSDPFMLRPWTPPSKSVDVFNTTRMEEDLELLRATNAEIDRLIKVRDLLAKRISASLE